MHPIKIFSFDNNKKINLFQTKKKRLLYFIIFTVILFVTLIVFNSNKIRKYLINNNISTKKNIPNTNISKNINIPLEKCYLLSDNTNIKIIHIIITRFIICFWNYDDFPQKIYKKDYVFNGIRVMKKYLLI